MRQEERRARTRGRLLDAAAEVFGRVGFHAATIDDVASAAGLTKGAVYANFEGKDGLFRALLDRHLDHQVDAVDRLLSGGDLRGDLVAASAASMGGDGSFGLLMLELWLYAARDDGAREALAERYERIRSTLAAALAERDESSGHVEGRDAAEMATVVLALDAGLFLQHLVDPDAVGPDLRARAIASLVDPQGGT
ncbi:MAG: TetR/AcrR family transcriptional regulator [Actinomycetota bacterium]|nr:TetR/AcrR family transcriptional regulator [Actinomycetota bacterium]